jgi:hypothetical protein
MVSFGGGEAEVNASFGGGEAERAFDINSILSVASFGGGEAEIGAGAA